MNLREEVRAEFIRDHRARVGDLHAAARRVRADTAMLDQHPERAYREDITGTLGGLCYDLGTHKGYPAVYWNPGENVAELLMVLGVDLKTREPRKFSSILASVRMDAKCCVLWFELPSEPADDLPYEAK